MVFKKHFDENNVNIIYEKNIIISSKEVDLIEFNEKNI